VLNRAFKEFLWKYDFDHLILCGKLHTPRRMCEVRLQRDDDIVIRTLQRGWESFSVDNEFEPGDTIRFKFFDGVFSHYVHAFKIDD
jgi:hypothetical protein